ncbi:amphi-Trp domain-containing protein [Epibacterium sp. SM1979]|uniref:Amphi-Trp domain-containing protein n=1 Tax=Tritonibacter litoralis TaxID=2662264 RepID=A0A843YGC9_9RHOB|nr:amphi-Trp domain-containing protein [Tritonibacter litoralis]MQQ10196.1 amphi-Trp domain-containing protein [Tritonibacter litoralis]
MGYADGKFRHESLQDRKTIKSLLEALTKGISKGELTLGEGDDELVLPVDGLMTLRLKADRSDGQCKVDMRISWSEQQEKPAKSAAPTVK